MRLILFSILTWAVLVLSNEFLALIIVGIFVIHRGLRRYEGRFRAA